MDDIIVTCFVMGSKYRMKYDFWKVRNISYWPGVISLGQKSDHLPLMYIIIHAVWDQCM